LLAPDSNFDTLKSARELASGGPPHGAHDSAFLEKFRAKVRSLLFSSRIPSSDFSSFLEFVSSGAWERSGSSSVGRLSFTYNGESFTPKARKNLVWTTIPYTRLAQDALASDSQVGVVALKEEPGKVRIVVAGDLYTNLKMAYLSSKIERNFGSWWWLYYSDSASDWIQLVNKTRNTLRSYSSMPYDMKTIDHQPNQSEMLVLATEISRYAVFLSPVDVSDIASNVVSSMSKITLEIRDPPLSIPQKGGVPSGVQWTTLFDSLWNAAMILLAADQLALSIPDLITKGDDSMIFDTPARLLALKTSMDSLDVVASDGKFTITKYPEFLRRRIFPGSVFGYPARAVSSISQRKPWNPDPVHPRAKWLNAAESFVTFDRRAVTDNYPAFFQVILRNIGQWATTPISQGGIGLISDTLSWLPGSRSVLPPTPDFAPFPPDNVQTRTEIFDIYHPLTYDQRSLICLDQASAALVSDDIPAISSSIRRAWRKNFPTKWKTFHLAPQPRGRLAAGFGSFAYMSGVVGILSTISRRVPDFKIGRWLDEHQPFFSNALRNFEHRFRVSRGLALDWLVGKPPVTMTWKLHPMLQEQADLQTATQFLGTRGDPAFVQAWITRRLVTDVLLQIEQRKYFSF
jgi:hypothetical protein